MSFLSRSSLVMAWVFSSQAVLAEVVDFTFEAEGLFSFDRGLLEVVSGKIATESAGGWVVSEGRSEGYFSYDNNSVLVGEAPTGDPLYRTASDIHLDFIVDNQVVGSNHSPFTLTLVTDDFVSSVSGNEVDQVFVTASSHFAGAEVVQVGQYYAESAGLLWLGDEFFSGAALPDSLPPLGYQNATVAFNFTDINTGVSAGSVFVSGLTITPVPVPAALWLFGSALLGLAGIKRLR